MKCILVSHTHWDREWYRTFQQFRARLVDAVDLVIEHCQRDPGYRFVLDGQAVILEDYVAIRPERRELLEALVRGGQVAIGPWYVQPDSLIPSGEAHVRNLLEGRRAGEAFGPISRVAYTPDSFGHPAQFPQLLAGFGFEAFVYWRGNGDEIAELPSEYRWQAPDGSSIPACHLGRGYFAAAALPRDPEQAVRQLLPLVEALRARSTGDQVILMNGIDHQLPDAHTREVAEALAKETGWEVQRGVFEDFTGELDVELPRFSGELLGGHLANLLPGVWSTHMDIKLRNRACEMALEGWAEPWAALGQGLGLPDERPALRLAWRELLANQAHDSLCGCSRDAVHRQMDARYDAAQELAEETARRVIERVAGLPVGRETPWSDEPELAVFNPSPHWRTDLVRFRLDPVPAVVPTAGGPEGSALHPLLQSSLEGPGYHVDGEPARVVPARENGRYQLLEARPALDVEFVARDVPPFGWKRCSLRRCDPVADEVDDGDEISNSACSVSASADGTLDVRLGRARFEGLGALEDAGDRGDTYDFDPVAGSPLNVERVEIRRTRHASGLQWLEVSRHLRVPAGLDADRRERSRETAHLEVVLRAGLVPGVERVSLGVRVRNEARDHRLRLLFPTGGPVTDFLAASTFDAARRRPGAADASRWIHAAPTTFPHQGWIAVNGLTVAAPGLPEAEVTADGTIAITLLRSVGWLSRMDLATRPQPAGPAIPTPGAQCLGELAAELALLPGIAPRAARDAELGLQAVAAGPSPRVPAGRPVLELSPPELLLTAVKPAESGEGSVVRVLNPGDVELAAELRMGLPVRSAESVRLDESADDWPVRREDDRIRFRVPPRALRSVHLR